MPKARSAYVKKRRQFRGNRYITKEEREENIQTTSSSSSDDVQNEIMSEPESSPQPSASARKIKTPEPMNTEGTEGEPTGYRFMDLSILSGGLALSRM